MLIWVLIVSIHFSGPMNKTFKMPYLGFDSQKECAEAAITLPEDSKWDCVAFATDKIDDQKDE